VGLLKRALWPLSSQDPGPNAIDLGSPKGATL
jgi:hypothetical protein